MAVTPVAYYTTSYSSTSDQTFNFSSLLKVSDNSAYTIAQDDLVVVWCFHSGTAGGSLSKVTALDPGATAYPIAVNSSVITQSDTNFTTAAASGKFMGATPDASVTTKGCAAATNSMLVIILVFSGVDQTTPLAGVTPVTATAFNGARPDCGSITTPASPSGCVVVGFGGQASALGTALTNPTTTPFDATARYTGIVSRTTATNNGSTGYGIKTGVGTSTAFDPSVWNGGQSTNTGSNGSLIFVLRPTGATYSITADGGSFVLTGASVNLPLGRKVIADSGSFVLTGASATLAKATLFAAGGGSFALTGTDVSFRVGKTMTADAGSFVLTGADASFLATRIFTVGGGSFAVTGADADLRFFAPPTLSAGSGLFTLSFSDATMVKDRAYLRYRRARRGAPITRWR